MNVPFSASFRVVCLTAVGVAAMATSAMSQEFAPADALPLSQIIAAVENNYDIAQFDEVEWDSDGYWEAEFFTVNGAKVEIRVDPVTGAEIPR